jgi:hypothetical protein
MAENRNQPPPVEYKTDGRYERAVLDPPALPPDGFNPIYNPEDQARLEEFWLPSRPDPEREPDLYEHWKEMFTEPLRFVLAESRSFLVAPFEASSNWSGGYVLPHDGNRFTRVVGRWQVPEVQLGAGPNPKSMPFCCSIWVGLDGKKRWTRSMPQVGTVQTIALDGTRETPSLWWQWWLRDKPSGPNEISGVKIKSGDVVLCSLTVMSPNLVRFHVKNRNTGSFATIAVSEPKPVLGATAEWVVERPADPDLGSGGLDPGPLFPLPDYGSVTLERCAARVEIMPGSGKPHHFHWQPRLIRMIQTLPGPTRTAVISTPVRRGQPQRTLKVLYRRP